MDINHNIQFNDDKELIHFLNIENLSAQQILEILELADTVKSKSLNEKTVASLFFEPSTRTKTTFELAAKRLGVDFINIDIANSSTSKGESIVDMIKTLEAMQCNMFIVRHSTSGIPHYIAEQVGSKISVINAGDGTHAHPTQAMLDMYTIKKYKTNFKDLNVAIVGDILHSRVAKSLIASLNILRVKNINIIGPKNLMPDNLNDLKVNYHSNLKDGINDADVIIMLRLQKERMHKALISTEDYYNDFGLTKSKIAVAKKDVIVMHPGPINRGVEITSDVADSDQSIILDQVENGVDIRMAVIYLLAEKIKREA